MPDLTESKDSFATENNQVSAKLQGPITPQQLIDGKVGSKNFIYGAINSGQIKHHRIGGKIIIDPVWARDVLGW